jgi:hypothetical protein
MLKFDKNALDYTLGDNVKHTKYTVFMYIYR